MYFINFIRRYEFVYAKLAIKIGANCGSPRPLVIRAYKVIRLGFSYDMLACA